MTKKISNLSFPVLMFSCIFLTFILFAVFSNEISLVLGLTLIFFCLFLLFNFTSVELSGNRISIINYFGFIKPKAKSIMLGDVKELNLITIKRIVSIPGYDPRDGGGRNIENRTYEITVTNESGDIILVEKSSKYEWIYKLAIIIAEYYNITINEVDKDASGISKGYFNGFKPPR